MTNNILDFNQIQRDLLVGTLLGSGNLKTVNKWQTWRYTACHGEDLKEYLFFKYEILKDFCKSSPYRYSHTDKRTNKVYTQYSFSTITTQSLTFYGELFYKEDLINKSFIRRVPLNIADYLTPRVLAIWYMDNGTLKWSGKSNAMVFCTESLMEEEVNVLSSALRKLFNLDLSIVRRNNKVTSSGYRLVVSEKNAKSFRDVILPFVVPSLLYKISNGYKGHL